MLGLRRPSDLLTVTEIDEAPYDELVRLRAGRVPLQHLVGSVGFRHLDLLVGPGVFVPRPETELVAGWVVDHLARATGIPNPVSGARNVQRGSPIAAAGPLVVDLCSGSGAIALSVAREVPGSVVHAVEIDPVALDWARRNDPRGFVTWHEGPVAGCLAELDGTVDVVVSNPPYVPLGTEVDAETRHDPRIALYGGADGLDVVRQVEAAARRLLRPGGALVVEHDVTQGESAPALLREAGGWVDAADHTDLTGRARFVTARWHP